MVVSRDHREPKHNTKQAAKNESGKRTATADASPIAKDEDRAGMRRERRGRIYRLYRTSYMTKGKGHEERKRAVDLS